MSARTAKRGFVLLVDIVGSSDITEFTKGRNKRLERLSKRHAALQWIKAPYTITAWDEFQTYVWDSGVLPELLLGLRQGFAPWELHVGVGGGEIQGWRSKRPINEAAGGEAFENARAAMDELKGGGFKYPRLTQFCTGDQQRDDILNLVYGLHDTLAQGVTERQWETIGQALEGKSQEKIAAALGVSASTVTRNLQRGHYWQMRETIRTLSEMLPR